MMQSPTALRLERTYSAPAQAVFDAWTNVEVIRRWWHAGGPDWANTHAEVDVRVGGRIRITMHAADGEEYSGGGGYTEIQPPHRQETLDNLGRALAS